MAVNVYGALAVAEAFRDHVAASKHKNSVCDERIRNHLLVGQRLWTVLL